MHSHALRFDADTSPSQPRFKLPVPPDAQQHGRAVAFRKKTSGSETRKRGPIIGFRATEEERARMEASAQRAGLTLGSYVRSRALAKPTTRAVRRPSVETAQLAQLLGMLGALSGSVQALVRKHGGSDVVTSEELKESLMAFREAVAAILLAMGKHASLSHPALSKDSHDH